MNAKKFNEKKIYLLLTNSTFIVYLFYYYLSYSYLSSGYPLAEILSKFQRVSSKPRFL